ncbi:BTAD domain-containing putative transcriptional regulator [Saccharothrix obliqua]|uniref:BTAD domain-containing putative transcriptional regulator n=1 Tax=Saccharothrix obliqua TaxID=2861747 RepID=UPI0027E22E91|nr:BTAD domain-containing putative transcriptional regulator [Saccharothrix obliqua]
MLGFAVRLARGVPAAVVLTALLAGLPWALTHFVGWPLPDHPPSPAEIQRVLLSPMTTTFLLNVLACLAWPTWVFFTLDVVRSAIRIARDTRLPNLTAAGPVHRTAAVLVGAVLISVLGQRIHSSAPSTPTGSAAVATAAIPALLNTSDYPTIHHGPHRTAQTAADTQPTYAKTAVVLPRDPETGVHDSLWRIAQRILGDGTRWPEIYELNKGKPQPDGGTLTRPDLIYPGEELTLPDDATPPTAPPVPPPPTPPRATTPPPSSQVVPRPPTTSAPPDTAARGEPGFGGTEFFVGLGLVAAVSTALVVARHHNRRRYRPGSGDRGDLPIAPVVYRLRLAHLPADHECPEPDADSDQLEPRTRLVPTPPVVLGHDDSTFDGREPVLPVGVRDGREIALDLAAVHGLGLLGAGATDATRALLVTILTAADGDATVVLPAQHLTTLLGRRAAQAPRPANLHVTTDLDTALDMLESETLVRIGQAPAAGRQRKPLVLVTATPTGNSRRLQAVLDNGSAVGVAGLLLGQWNSGVTAYVRDDGVISATNPGPGEPLRGTRVYHLGDDHTADLLTLLHSAEPATAGQAQEPTAEHTVNEPTGDTHPEPTTHDQAGRQSDHPHRLEILESTTRQPTPHIDQAVPTTAVPERETAPAPLRITTLGPPQVWWRPDPADPEREVTAAFQPRLRELLLFLALHPHGTTREALTAALWPTSPPERTTNAMNTSLTRLRHAFTTATKGTLTGTAVVVAGEGRYHLAPDLVQVDYWHFATAVHARRTATTDHQRIEAYRRIVDTYCGPLADGMNTEWIETAREATRRDAIDAVAALARALVTHDPQQTLDLLETARAFDPHNELIYRDIMRLQERLGHLDAVPRTLTLLTTRLAELDDRPTPQTVGLAERLCRRHDPP